jgi:O-antigen/teichoic acid export membrane protein
MTRVLTRKQGNEQEFVTLIFRIVAGGILPVAFLGAVLSPTAILLIFGGDYQGAAWMLSALMIYVVLTLVNSVFTCALIGGGQERLYSVRMIMGSIGMVVLVTILTLGGGVPGTVIGVVIGEMAIVGLMISAVAGKLGLRISPVQPDLLVGAIVLLAAYLLLQDPVFQVPVGVGVYALVLIAFRSFPVAELRDLRRRLA